MGDRLPDFERRLMDADDRLRAAVLRRLAASQALPTDHLAAIGGGAYAFLYGPGSEGNAGWQLGRGRLQITGCFGAGAGGATCRYIKAGTTLGVSITDADGVAPCLIGTGVTCAVTHPLYQSATITPVDNQAFGLSAPAGTVCIAGVGPLAMGGRTVTDEHGTGTTVLSGSNGECDIAASGLTYRSVIRDSTPPAAYLPATTHYQQSNLPPATRSYNVHYRLSVVSGVLTLGALVRFGLTITDYPAQMPASSNGAGSKPAGWDDTGYYINSVSASSVTTSPSFSATFDFSGWALAPGVFQGGNKTVSVT